MLVRGVVTGARRAATLTDIAAAAVAAYVFTIPIEEILSIPLVGSPARLAGLIALPLGIIALYGGGRVRFRRPLLFIVIAAVIVAWNLATYLWSVDPAATVRQVSRYAQLAAVAWLVSEFCRTRIRLLWLMQAFVLGNYVAFGVTVYNVLIASSGTFRDTGPFNANQFSIILALGIPMAVLLMGEGRTGLVRVLNIAYPWIATFGVVLGASRSGLIVCLIALTVVPFSALRLDPFKRWVLLAAVLSALWFSFGYAPEVFPDLYRNIERLQETSDELTTGTLTGRTTIWRETLAVFRESPVIGVGSGAVPYALTTTALGRSVAVHNAYLSVAAGSGVIGLALFIGLVGLALAAAFQADRAHRPYLVILGVALLVAMMPANSEARKDTWFILSLLAVQRPISLTLVTSTTRPGPPTPA